MGKYFGTDGFRGEVGANLTAEHAFKIGRFLGWYYTDKRRNSGDTAPAKILIGRDTRLSGSMLEQALVSAICASGARAYVLGVVTTPCVSYITRSDNFDCGIMISASHNPYFDNGIKLFDCNGEKLDDGVICLIERYLDGEFERAIPNALREEVGCVEEYPQGVESYKNFLISLGTSLKGLKVGLDTANGSASYIAKSVFESLGATVSVINCTPDGLNINKNAGSTHIEGLCKLVKGKGLDVGFAYDGDADRCLCSDEKGEVVNGDKILYVYASYLKEKNALTPCEVVTTVMSNIGLYKALDSLGIGYAKTDVGDKNVREYMAVHGNKVGGEQSGHVIFSDYAVTGDGILTSLKMVEVMLAKRASLSALAAPAKDYPQTLLNIEVEDKKAILEDKDVLSAVKRVEEELGDGGRILFRASGTEPLIRVMVEASSEKESKRLAQSVIDTIRLKISNRNSKPQL